ncbi:MAG: CCA tRNA nucleotidyltransferase [Nitrososphaerales archaeon]
MMSHVLKQALKLVEPTQKEIDSVGVVAKKALAVVKETSSKFHGVVDVSFGGSYAKGTWLKDDVDIDIFVKVRSDVEEKEFEVIGRQLGVHALKKYKPYLRYSEHPYVEAFVDKIRVDVVPCYDVEKGKWKSAADRSPYHAKFIKESLSEEKKREARILKKFMKTIGVYGAEIATNGFSGYVSEVLVLKYGTCMGVLQAASEFKESQVISIGSFNEDIARLFNSSLIIIDPIDNKRNLGTAISDECVGRMILAARRFVAKPHIRFFKSASSKKGLTFANDLVLIKFKYKKRSPDIIWGQLKSSARAIAKQLSIHGFRVIRYSTSTDEMESAVFVFLLQAMKLPKTIVRQGPKVFDGSDSEQFLRKNLEDSNLVWIGDDSRLFALRDNKFVDAIAFIKFLLSSNISASGISGGLMNDIKRGFQIYSGNRLKSVKEGFAKEAMRELVATDQFTFG